MNIATSPIQISHLYNNPIPFSILSEITILWVLDGEMNLRRNQTLSTHKADDLILINRNEAFSILDGSYEALRFQVNLNALRKSLTEDFPLRLVLDDTTPMEYILRFKNHLALYSKHYFSGSSGAALMAESLSLNILHDMHTFFASTNSPSTTTTSTSTSFDRIAEICQYINANYNKHLSLESIAQQFFITPQYISRLFKECINMSFLTYVNQVRLTHGVHLLQTTNMSLEQISETCGFPNSRAFASCFKKAWDMLPSQFRQTHTHTNINKPVLTLPSESYEKIIEPYLTTDEVTIVPTPISTRKFSTPDISLLETGHPIQKTYLQTLSINFSLQLMYATTQEMLKEIQKDVGFSYLYLPRFFDDEMYLFRLNPDNTYILNYNYADIILDFLRSIHLTPHFLLDVIPSKLLTLILSDNKEEGFKIWKILLEDFIHHCEVRYGKAWVNTWMISISPNLNRPYPMIFEEDWDIFVFYQKTYQVIKEINPAITIGSPVVIAETMLSNSWVEQFLNNCMVHQIMPDILNLNLYPVIFDMDLLNKLLPLHFTSDPDAIRNLLQKIYRKINSNHWIFKKYLITGWNFTFGPDLLNDTLFRAVYTTKNVLDNLSSSFEFSCYTLSDFDRNVPLSQEPFWGAMGLYTQARIKKPIYYAWKFLGQLGSHKIASGEGYYITKENDSIQILLYHYIHFAEEYSNHQFVDISYKNRYAQFEEKPNLEISLSFTAADGDLYSLTETILNQKNGSSFDTWLRIDAMPLNTKDSTDFIASTTAPFIHSEKIQASHNTLSFQRTLAPLEIRFIVLRPLH